MDKAIRLDGQKTTEDVFDAAAAHAQLHGTYGCPEAARAAEWHVGKREVVVAEGERGHKGAG